MLTSFQGIPRNIWLLSVVSLINRSGAMVICFITLYLTSYLGFSIKEAGYVMACYGVGAIIGAYMGGQWVDKFGYYKTQFWTLIANGALLLVLLLVKDFWWMCLAICIMNISAEAFRPANSIAIKTHSDIHNRTRSISLMRVFVNLAVSFALVIGGLLIKFGWHWIFWADGITCFAAAAMVYWLVPEQKINTETLIETKNTDFITIKSLSAYKDKDFIIFVVATFLSAMVFMQIVWTVPVFFKQVYGWDEAMIGFMSAINGLVVMTVELPLITKVQHKRSPLWFARLGVVFYAISYLAFVLPIQFSILLTVFYMVFISLGETFVMPFSSTWAINRSSEDRQGQYMAFYTMAYSVSNVFAPLMGTQIIAAFGFTTLWITLAFISAITWLAFWRLEK